MINNVNIFRKLLDYIKKDIESFNILVNIDNPLGINPSSEDIINFIEFFKNEKALEEPIVGNILITEGDIVSILEIIHDLVYYEGEYILYINDSNIGVITYLIDRINKIFMKYNFNIKIKIDYSRNYNEYLNSLVSVVGNSDFVNTIKDDFANANQIIV